MLFLIFEQQEVLILIVEEQKVLYLAFEQQKVLFLIFENKSYYGHTQRPELTIWGTVFSPIGSI